ncbi:MAG TPA: hypothetical protein VMH91_02955 [Candidatus Paceibacterota bacterium]|nr:hypothetical protein [Candidatus Paceibacterota bacterium]
MFIDPSELSEADRQWGDMKARQMGVSPVVPENAREVVLTRSALLLADVRHTKRKLGVPVPDEGTSLS